VAFFAVPYTIVIYPIAVPGVSRLWHVCHKHGYITAGDFVRGRFGNRWLALAVTVTGIVATMPYIALQLVGIQVVIGALGISGTGLAADLPLIIAFVVLAAFTYSSGLRAPASIAIVKDILIYITALRRSSSFRFSWAASARSSPPCRPRSCCWRCPAPNTTGSYSAYATLALGSRWRCSCIRIRSRVSERQQRQGHPAQRRHAAGLFLHAGPAGLFGFFVIAAASTSFRNTPRASSNSATTSPCRRCCCTVFRPGSSASPFAAIGIGALVPAAIMSIAAANLYTRNIHREFINKNPTDKQESQMAKLGVADRQGGRAGIHPVRAHRSTPFSCSCWAASGSFRRCRR
jgi:SSS family solute:Na+ symporter